MKNKQHQMCPSIEYTKNNESVSIGERADEWETYLHQIMDCPKMPYCNRTIFKLDIEKTKLLENPVNPTNAYLKIQLESPNVQNIIDSYSYDLQSLIGEVGGTLGLFLGLSTYSFVEFIEYLINKLRC